MERITQENEKRRRRRRRRRLSNNESINAEQTTSLRKNKRIITIHLVSCRALTCWRTVECRVKTVNSCSLEIVRILEEEEERQEK